MPKVGAVSGLPTIMVGAFSLPAGENPTAMRSGTDAEPVLTFGIPAGSPGLRWMGVWSAATPYVPGDVVQYNGSGYVNRVANTGTAPLAGTTSATWGVLALNGSISGARSTATFTTSGAVAGTNYTGNVVMATGYRLLSVQTSAAARVRLYTDNASRSADITRVVTVSEPDNSGLVLDYVTTGTTAQKIAPAVHGYSMETVPSANIPITVTPTGSTAVTVTLTFVVVE